MTIVLQNFTPKNCTVDGNYTIAATTTGANQVLQQPPQPSQPSNSGGVYSGNGYSTIRVYNSGTNPVFLSWGNTNQAAVVTTSSVVVAPGATSILDMGNPYTNLGVIYGTGTGNVYVSLGQGCS